VRVAIKKPVSPGSSVTQRSRSRSPAASWARQIVGLVAKEKTVETRAGSTSDHDAEEAADAQPPDKSVKKRRRTPRPATTRRDAAAQERDSRASRSPAARQPSDSGHRHQLGSGTSRGHHHRATAEERVRSRHGYGCTRRLAFTQLAAPRSTRSGLVPGPSAPPDATTSAIRSPSTKTAPFEQYPARCRRW